MGPGQFVIVRVAEGGERIPLTVVEAFADGGLTLIVQAVGKTTRELCALRAGDALRDGRQAAAAIHDFLSARLTAASERTASRIRA